MDGRLTESDHWGAGAFRVWMPAAPELWYGMALLALMG